tara:strand:+ start:69 stop:500 length:432 start_codon:yes stop_codon:yes gene_type:complete
MASIAGNALQERMRQFRQLSKRPMALGKNTLEVEILQAFDADSFNKDGVPPSIAHLVLGEPGTMVAYVQAIKSKRKFYVRFRASEAEILKTHGNAVLLEGVRGTIAYNGLRPEEGRLELLGEPTRVLRNSGGTGVFDVVSFVG